MALNNIAELSEALTKATVDVDLAAEDYSTALDRVAEAKVHRTAMEKALIAAHQTELDASNAYDTAHQKRRQT